MVPTASLYRLLLARASLRSVTIQSESERIDDYVRTWPGKSRNKQRRRCTTCTARVSLVEAGDSPPLFSNISCRQTVLSRLNHIEYFVFPIASASLNSPTPKCTRILANQRRKKLKLTTKNLLAFAPRPCLWSLFRILEYRTHHFSKKAPSSVASTYRLTS